MKVHCVRWEPVAGIAVPCSHLYYASMQPAELRVSVTLLGDARSGSSSVLELLFPRVAGLRWAEEFWGSVLWPQSLPRFESAADPQHRTWAFPLCEYVEADWLDAHRAFPLGKNFRHFAIVTLGDCLEVMSELEPSAKWGSSHEA